METGALKYSSAMADSKKATDKQHWLCDSKKQPLGPRPKRCMRRHFPVISFLSVKYNLVKLTVDSKLRKMCTLFLSVESETVSQHWCQKFEQELRISNDLKSVWWRVATCIIANCHDVI